MWQSIGLVFDTLFKTPILNTLVALYKLFLFIKLPGAFGFAIIGLTVLVRLLLHPFFKQQLETAKKMQEIKPHLDKLSVKHKNDKTKLQQEQLKLYQQFGINPASGCLFMIVQIPVFIALYNTLSLLLINGGVTKTIETINKVLYFPALKIQAIDPWFFGFNLAVSPQKSGQWHYYLIPVITAVLQYLQVQASQPGLNLPAKDEKKPKKTDKKSEEGTDDFQKVMSTQMKFIFPLMIGWFSFSLPVGLSLYWNIFSIFTIFQQKQLKVNNPKLK